MGDFTLSLNASSDFVSITWKLVHLHIVNKGKWLWNLAKFFVVCCCCYFLFIYLFLAILGVDPPRNLARNKRWLCALRQLINRRSIAIMWFIHGLWPCIKPQKMCRVKGPSNITLACLFASLVFNHFPLLTMIYVRNTIMNGVAMVLSPIMKNNLDGSSRTRYCKIVELLFVDTFPMRPPLKKIDNIYF